MTLVLLHGFLQTPAAWDELTTHLDPQRRTLRPSLLGHAQSEAIDGALTFDEEVDRLAALVRAEHAEGAHLVGYSLGARVALGLLARHPRLFSRATLVGVHAGLEDRGEREARRMLDEARAAALEAEGVERFVDAWEREPIFATQARLPEATRARHRAMRLALRAEGLAASLRVLGLGVMPSRWDALGSLAPHVTLVTGAEDARFRGVALRMAERIPRCRMRVVGGVGHDVVLEAPAALAAIVAEEIDEGAVS